MPDRNCLMSFCLLLAGGDVMDSMQNLSTVVAISTFVTNTDDDIF